MNPNYGVIGFYVLRYSLVQRPLDPTRYTNWHCHQKKCTFHETLSSIWLKITKIKQTKNYLKYYLQP